MGASKGQNKRLRTGSHFFSKVAPGSLGFCRNREPLLANQEPLLSNQIERDIISKNTYLSQSATERQYTVSTEVTRSGSALSNTYACMHCFLDRDLSKHPLEIGIFFMQYHDFTYSNLKTLFKWISSSHAGISFISRKGIFGWVWTLRKSENFREILY